MFQQKDEMGDISRSVAAAVTSLHCSEYQILTTQSWEVENTERRLQCQLGVQGLNTPVAI